MAISVASVISEISEITIQSFTPRRQSARGACVNLDIVNSPVRFGGGPNYVGQVHGSLPNDAKNAGNISPGVLG
ncbi:hypothetical protein K6M90_26215 [Rhizobium sp. 9T]|uniref:Uncharacterized protein n=1 Tax=Rhizobium croatiense TaxID=2867516 RepID=A0ABS7M5C3_9HYPH|nr:hypothetical protein [Rhizobium croatiense]MBY4611141.1 hypothetical protein [Rhizobium croatiense]MBY4632098.1 hypothetical protein [Rhizobium croatiense]